MSREQSSDPLPFTQLDRTVKAKAALLAGAMGVSTQHAVGSLLAFWDLNGDPRDLEKLVEQGKDAVVLTHAQTRLRFQIASGKEVEPELLAEVGFLEPVGDALYRVRGMSRYFKPIARRIQARAAASLGGKATAAKLRRNGGKFVAETIAGAPAGESLEHPVQRKPAVEPSEPPSEHQATTSREARREPSLEDRGQRIEVIYSKDVAGSTEPPPAKEPKEHHRVIAEVCRIYETHAGAPYAFTGRDAKHVGELRALAREPEEIFARWELALKKRDKWPKVMTLGALVTHWNEFPVRPPQ